MHKFILGAMVLSLGVGLSACKQSTSAHGVYYCERGVVLNITFTDGKKVNIKSNSGGEYELNRITSASGAKYESEGSIFFSKGVEAMFIADVGVKPVECRRG